MKIVTFSALLSYVVVGACTSMTQVENPRATLRVDQAQYSLGEIGVVTLENRSDSDIGYNFCFGSFAYREAGAWNPAGGRTKVCLGIMRSLRKGQSATMSFNVVEPFFEPGEQYRFVLTVEHLDTGKEKTVFSNIFIVQE